MKIQVRKTHFQKGEVLDIHSQNMQVLKTYLQKSEALNIHLQKILVTRKFGKEEKIAFRRFDCSLYKNQVCCCTN